MDILIIGGTQFVGRALSQAALDRGHKLTLFHRGKTNSDLFPTATHILGDRDGDLANLGDNTWDVVIDTCGYFPRVVTDAAEYLKDKVERYIFISTISVYDSTTEIGITEDAALAGIEDPTTEEVTGETYGGLKVLCEQAAEAVMPNRVLQIRPGFIIGPHDHTMRFPYWVHRTAKGGAMLAPAPQNLYLQAVDARDLAEFTIKMAEEQATGTYHVTGLGEPMQWGDILQTGKDVADADTEFEWVDADFLEEHAKPGELPMWIPSEEGQALMQVDISKALDAGLTHRPLAETMRDTLAWLRDSDADVHARGALSPEREQELLEAYRNQ